MIFLKYKTNNMTTSNITENVQLAKPKCSRKGVEYNAFELVFAVCILDFSIKNKSEILNIDYDTLTNKLKGCSQVAFEKYKDDLKTRTNKVVDAYIEKIHESRQFVTNLEIQFVYLEGKLLHSPELKELNKGIDNKKAKSDVYIKTTDGTYIGFSIKQDNKCTKTNYSVEKILGNFILDKKLQKEYKKQFLDARTNTLFDGIGSKTVPREKRKMANSLFYNSLGNDNLYWSLIRTEIYKHNDEIKQILVNSMFPTGLPYDIYEFDGNEMAKLNVDSDMNSARFEEYIPYYYKKNDITNPRRREAKMYYQLRVNDKKYRIELRWKGDCKGSVQFQTHPDATDL